MAKKLSFEGRERDVSFVDWDQPAEVPSDDAAMYVRVARPAPDALQLAFDGRHVSVSIARAPDGLWVWHRGRARFVADEEDGGRVARRRGPGGIPNAVTPPMPATVVRILVETGQRVVKGQGMVVVSAMKMETTLSSPHDGVVKSINTEVGTTVRPGEVLVDVSREPAEA
jgi:biotin carboxyl carrier protein